MGATMQLDVEDYLLEKKILNELVISPHFSFHWANWDQSCHVKRSLIKKAEYREGLEVLHSQLLELKKIPLYLRNKVKVTRTDLYSLYESYLDSRLRLMWFDHQNEILFSTGSEHGPYYTLTSMKWIDKNIYAQFVLRKILLDYVILRSFRLSCKINLSLKFDNDLNFYQNKLTLHQCSETGIILRFSDKNFIHKIKNAQYLNIGFPQDIFTHFKAKDFEEGANRFNELRMERNHDVVLRLDSRILNFYGNEINFKHSSDQEFYVFCRYEDLLCYSSKFSFDNSLKSFVQKTRSYLEKKIMKKY